MSKKENAVAVQNNAVTTTNNAVPAFLQNRSGPARGSENVGAEDLVIPRLELVQALSPCLKKNDAGYIEGIEVGMLYNNVTRQSYGQSVQVIPVFFKKEFIVWKSRKLGGGFVGAFAFNEEAESVRLSQEQPDQFQVNETANMFCLLRNPETGKLEEIVVSMAITKLKVARKWNSLIRMNEGDSFSRVYEIGTAEERNKSNEEYQNITVRALGFVTEPEFTRAENLYEAVKSGIAVVNRDNDGEDLNTVSSSTEY